MARLEAARLEAARQEARLRAEEKRRREKFGIVQVGVTLAPFFANDCRERTSRIQKSVDDVEDMMVQVGGWFRLVSVGLVGKNCFFSQP